MHKHQFNIDTQICDCGKTREKEMSVKLTKYQKKERKSLEKLALRLYNPS